MPWEIFQSITDAMEIIGDPEMMAVLKRGNQDAQEHNQVSLSDLNAE